MKQLRFIFTVGGIHVKKNYTKIILDLMMAVTFVLLMNPRVLNGLPFHEIAGLVIGVAVLTHIGLNYRWVSNTTKKIFDPKLPKKARFSLLLNVLLLIFMAAVIVTGILISRVVLPSLAIQGNHTIRGIHSFSADATLAIVGLHVGVHWQWIMSVSKKAFKTKEGRLRNGVIASVALSLALLAGGLQWYSSTATSNVGEFKPRPELQNGQTFNNVNSTATADVTNIRQQPPKGDFREGKFRGKEGHGRKSNTFLVILTYFAIWAAIIIPTYYVEKRILRKKRKSTDIQPSIS